MGRQNRICHIFLYFVAHRSYLSYEKWIDLGYYSPQYKSQTTGLGVKIPL